MLGLWRTGRQTKVNRAGETRVRPNRDVLSAEHEGVTVLLDLRRQVFLGLDEVGTSIWKGIEAGAAGAEIENELEAQYDVPPDVLRADLQRFVTELSERGLVVRS